MVVTGTTISRSVGRPRLDSTSAANVGDKVPRTCSLERYIVASPVSAPAAACTTSTPSAWMSAATPGFRLNCNHPATHAGEQARVLAFVGADVEHETARRSQRAEVAAHPAFLEPGSDPDLHRRIIGRSREAHSFDGGAFDRLVGQLVGASGSGPRALRQ